MHIYLCVLAYMHICMCVVHVRSTTFKTTVSSEEIHKSAAYVSCLSGVTVLILTKLICKQLVENWKAVTIFRQLKRYRAQSMQSQLTKQKQRTRSMVH